jgi:hypothetical protein
VAARGFEEHERPDRVRRDERVRLRDRAVHVRFGGEVDDGVDLCDRRVDGVGVLDPRAHEGEARVGDQVREVLLPAGVGQLVEDDDVVAGLPQALAREVRADEAGPTADEQLHAITVSSR